MKLIQLYDSLLEGDMPIDDSFKIVPIPDYPNHKIGVDKEGAVSLLLKTHGEDSIRLSSRRLKYFEMLFNKECKIFTSKEQEEAALLLEKHTILTLKLYDRGIQTYFLSLCHKLLDNVGNTPDLALIATEIERILTLFQYLSRPPLKTIQGLFGELSVIYNAENTEHLVRAWHVEGNAAFDFDNGIDCLEAKTSSTEKRIHSFSNRQLIAPSDKSVFIASILINRSDFGISIFQLIDLVKAKIQDPKLFFKIDELAFQTLGDQVETAEDIRFDLEQAISSIQFYSIEAIPRISQENIPNGILNVKYDINFENIETTNIESKLL